MSQISGVLDPTTQAVQRRTTSQFSNMTSEDFIRIMFTELSNQDPFQPNDSAALLEQLNSIRSIESDIAVTDQLKSLVTENQLGAASNLIGKFVGGLTAENDRVAGKVVSVIRQGEEISLELESGWLIPIESVEIVVEAPEPTTSPTVPSGTAPEADTEPPTDDTPDDGADDQPPTA